jgi:DNA-binding beta-propeller fold protein YncE
VGQAWCEFIPLADPLQSKHESKIAHKRLGNKSQQHNQALAPRFVVTLSKPMTRLFSLLAIFTVVASAGTLYLPAYPASILVFDESKGQVIDRIPLETGTPLSMRLAPDRKKIYVTTIDHNGIEVIDVATHKVVNHFVLNTPTKQYRFRFRGGAADAEGKLFYTVTKEIDKLPEHFEVAHAKYTVVDLAQQKIIKTADMSPENELTNRLSFEVSPDGKYLYQFGAKMTILQTSDFKVADQLDLAQPDSSGMENVRLGNDLDLISQPGVHTSIFNASDPIVHNRVFGLARLDLGKRQVSYKPIGPAPGGMAGLQVTPDKKLAYTIVANGEFGKKRCEFWGFDLATDRLIQKAEVPCRSRFSFAMSSDGKKLYIYGAGFEIEVYDAASLQLEKTWDLHNDITFAGIAVLP